MDTHVRGYLLEQMKNDKRFGEKRMQEVAQVLFSYVNYLSRLNPGKRQQELEAQRLAAMVYLGDEQCKAAAQEIARRLLSMSSGMGVAKLDESGIRAELARLTRITDELSPQLQQEPSLLEYASVFQRLLRTPEEVSIEEINRSYLVGDVELTFQDSLNLFPDLARIVSPPRQLVTNLEGFPPLQTCNFEIANINIADVEDEPKTTPAINLQPFEYEIASIEVQKSGLFQRKTELIINRHRQQAYGFIEYLENKGDEGNKGNEIALEMVQIPGGTFMMGALKTERDSLNMGALKTEKDSLNSERPQHEVKVPGFFMGKYPVTQAQWKFVASLPQVNRELKSDPSRFKGENRPVEYVSWFDAVEYCDRISQHTGKNYRLPSEAEWEYACRAGTTTPFHFGETIISELANYNAEYTYGTGKKGIYRKETTVVGHFGVANAFGLYDMHGNVWEWCADQWHENYEGAPTDGSAWIDDNSNDNQLRLLRGGSWYNYPRICRSAFRYLLNPDCDDNDVIGFRVVCGVFSSRSLPST
jgi:formylglycine-generating enzyme required for sulfatase activity